MKPSLNILNSILRLKIKEISIDYKIKYDVTGKVHEVKPLVFELPKMAQQLTLGKNAEEMIAKINAFGDMIQLILPLGIVDKLPFLKEELKETITEVEAELRNQGIQKNKLYKLAKRKSLEYYILSSFLKPDMYPPDFRKIWKIIIALIQNKEDSKNKDDLLSIGRNYPQFGFRIIPLFIPFLSKGNERKSAYVQLGNYVNAECTSYLLSQLVNCKDGTTCGGIFSALSKQKLKDPQIQETLINFYRSKVKLNESSLVSLMSALKQFPNKQTFAIGREILVQNEMYSSQSTSRCLLEMGYPPKEIVDIFLPKLLTTNPRESKTAFGVLKESKKFSKYLPNVEDLLEVYIQTMAKEQNSAVAQDMRYIIKYKKDVSKYEKVISYLERDELEILKAILLLIGYSLDDFYWTKNPLKTKLLKRKYLSLINHQDRVLSRNALTVVKKIGVKEKNQGLILPILNLIDFDKDSQKSIESMNAINEILKCTIYDHRVTDIYLKALDLPDPTVKVAALHGLKYTPDTKLKESLSSLKDAPSKIIRDAYKDFLKAESVTKSSLLMTIIIIPFCFILIIGAIVFFIIYRLEEKIRPLVKKKYTLK